MIAWVDVETTGLDPRTDHLLEVALVVTDDNLEEIEHVNVICQPVGGWNVQDFDPVIQEMHSLNGLFSDVRVHGMRRYEAEQELMTFMSKYNELSFVPIAGSTIGFDRSVLREHMPAFERSFSYRSIDVSSLTELARRWAPEVYESRPQGNKAHRALPDVRESIAILKHYRSVGFVGSVRAQNG